MRHAACGGRMKLIAFAAAVVLAGCASDGPWADPRIEEYKAEINRLNAQLAAEAAERQRITRAAARREETLKRQLDAMKSIERGILEREDRTRTETR
jgi:outer membrane murein-binding lipoprotein Lpp